MRIGQYFSIKGRAQRTEFWLIDLVASVLFMAMVTLGSALLFFSWQTRKADALAALAGPGVIVIAGIFALAWVTLTVSARRLHDRDKSAWWLLLFYGPSFVFSGQGMTLTVLAILPLIWGYIEMGFMAGTDGPNRFDVDPNLPRKVEHEEAASWADRPIEELAASAAAAEPELYILRKRTPAAQRTSGSQKFGRRGATA